MDYPLIANTYDSDEILSAISVLLSDKVTMGKYVNQFETEFAKCMGCKYAVMVNSGSSANLLAFSVLTNMLIEGHIEPGSEILIPAVCWSTTYSPIIQLGLKPVFVDSEKSTLNIDLDDMERKITSKTKGVILVHVMGNCTDMDRFMEITERHGLEVIEDTCEALGSKFDNKFLGTFGRFGTFSFYYSHHITTFEGGMVTCNTEEDYNLLLCLRAHGWTRQLTNKKELEEKYSDIDSRFLFVNYGYNFRPTEIQGTIGLIQLKKLEEKNGNRKFNYDLIKQEIKKVDNFKNLGLCDEDSTGLKDPAWFSMPIFLLNDTITVSDYKIHLNDNGVDNRPVISGNMVRQPVVQMISPELEPENYPGAELIHHNGFLIGLPCTKLTQEKVCSLVKILLKPFSI